MPDDATTQEIQVPAAQGEVRTDGADDAGNMNVWLVLLFGVIVVLVSIQNLWLRRRAAREAQSEDSSS